MKIKVKSAPHKKENIKIDTPFIQLQGFLKFIGLAVTGGEAKHIIQKGIVRVNGEICTARGKKLKNSDTVSVNGTDYTIIAEENQKEENGN